MAFFEFFSSGILFLVECFEDFLTDFESVQDEKHVRSPADVTGFVNRNETTCNHSDDNVVHSESVIGLSTSGW